MKLIIIIIFFISAGLDAYSQNQGKATENAIFEFELNIRYYYKDSIPDENYQYKNGQLIRKRTEKDRYHEILNEESDSLFLDKDQVQELNDFCKINWSEEHHHGLCRALSPGTIKFEMAMGEKSIREMYAPCRTFYVIAPYSTLKELLDGFFRKK